MRIVKAKLAEHFTTKRLVLRLARLDEKAACNGGSAGDDGTLLTARIKSRVRDPKLFADGGARQTNDAFDGALGIFGRVERIGKRLANREVSFNLDAIRGDCSSIFACY
jgi:hypothetical protein